MRQAGVLAAAALHALTHHRDRLADDHANARAPGRGAARIHGSADLAGRVETNIVNVEVGPLAAPELSARLAASGVRMAPIAPTQLRAVTHLDVDTAGIDRALDAVRNALA